MGIFAELADNTIWSLLRAGESDYSFEFIFPLPLTVPLVFILDFLTYAEVN
jgi:hypothetical protein